MSIGDGHDISENQLEFYGYLHKKNPLPIMNYYELFLLLSSNAAECTFLNFV